MNTKNRNNMSILKTIMAAAIFLAAIFPYKSYAHCDSYDGPVIQDAYKALAENNVNLILKWVEPQFEREITDLFDKTLQYQNEDPQVFRLLEKHFLETLVRVHREGEGEPFTGLKPAGTTAKIISKTDAAISNGSLDGFLVEFDRHINSFIQKKYDRVLKLDKIKDRSVEDGRAYVEAYVDYTHSVEALHGILEHTGGHHAH